MTDDERRMTDASLRRFSLDWHGEVALALGKQEEHPRASRQLVAGERDELELVTRAELGEQGPV